MKKSGTEMGPEIRFRELKRRKDCTQAKTKETSAKGQGGKNEYGMFMIQ